MALLGSPIPLFKLNPQNHFRTTFTCHFKTPTKTVPEHTRLISRRAATTALVISTSLLLAAKEVLAFDFRMTVPDQTVEEAESAVQGHAQSLLQVKALLEPSTPEAWKAAQKALRKSASYLKQDLYTLIQGKPSSERPRLRKLYSDLFNGVTGLDYAARDGDASRVWECYGNIVLALNDILSRL